MAAIEIMGDREELFGSVIHANHLKAIAWIGAAI
jgi:hypothetical protein